MRRVIGVGVGLRGVIAGRCLCIPGGRAEGCCAAGGLSGIAACGGLWGFRGFGIVLWLAPQSSFLLYHQKNQYVKVKLTS